MPGTISPVIARAHPQFLPVVTAGLCLLVGLAVADQHGSQMLLLLVAVAVVFGALFAPPHLVIGGALAILGAHQISQNHPLHVGAITIYTTDILLGLLLLRGITARERAHARQVMVPSLVIPLTLWAAVVLLAGWKGHAEGNSVGQIARFETSLVYFIGFSWGFARLAAEKATDVKRVIRAIAIVGLGFVAFALYTRIVHQRFDATQALSTGTVVTSVGNLRRDYGLFTAFELYPLLALGGLAYLLFMPRTQRKWPVIIVCVELAATVMTLVRGMIFGLVAAAVVLLVMAFKSSLVKLGPRLVPIVGAFLLIAVPFSIVQPNIAYAVAERVLPGVLPQTANADRNTEYRVKVLQAGEQIAHRDTFGMGFVTPDEMTRNGYEPIFLPHSMWAAILAFEGWPGLILFVWVLIAVVRRSRQMPAATPWLHPLLVAAVVMTVVEGFGWNVLFSMVSGMGMLALIVGLRFGQSNIEQQEAV
jgi:hypothetical protein